jgi:hypothetical protein
VRIFESGNEMIGKMEIVDLAGKRLFGLVEKTIKQVEDILTGVQELLAAANKQPEVIMLGVPGIEIMNKMEYVDLASLQSQNLSQYFQEQTQINTYVVNDANAVAYGAIGRLDVGASLVSLYYPYQFGPGVGIVINGKPMIGANGAAGEIAAGPFYESQKFPVLDLTSAVVRDVQNLVTLIDPKYIVVYALQAQLDGDTIARQRKNFCSIPISIQC